MSGRFYIGTSGWNYKQWQGSFYPADMKQSQWLEFYCQHFDTVEINNTFYHLPKNDVFKKWQESVPESFVFVVKASRFITHMKKLHEPQASTKNFLENASALHEKLGAVLFQLPPFWNVNEQRLEQFLEYISSQKIITNLRSALELRNSSWAIDKIYEILKNHNVALCFADWPELKIQEPVTADFVYFRRHGPAALYSSGYSTEMLRHDAEQIKSYLSEGLDVFSYFNNDSGGFALRNAMTLRKMVSG